MPHVRIPLDFEDREPFKKLAAKVGPHLAAAMHVRLLVIAGEDAPMTGTLSNEPLLLEARVWWKGRRLEGFQALLEAGYLEKTETGYKVVDWEKDHWYLKFFHERAKKAAKARHAKTGVLDGA